MQNRVMLQINREKTINKVPFPLSLNLLNELKVHYEDLEEYP